MELFCLWLHPTTIRPGPGVDYVYQKVIRFARGPEVGARIMKHYLKSLTLIFLSPVLAIGQLSGLVHMLEVPHSICPGHGVLIHNENTPGDLDEPPVPAGEFKPSRGAAGSAESHEHRHCADFSNLNENANINKGSFSGPIQEISAGPRISVFCGECRSADLISAAPKHSPPAVV